MRERENGICKGPEMRETLACLGKRMEASIVGERENGDVKRQSEREVHIRA